jgi:predicted Zn-dependent protease
MAKQAQDLAAERSKCESLRAQLHGMQDGALLRDTQAALAAERKRADEAIRRLQHMHSAHSDSVQWYQNAVAQALKSLDALPAKLDFEGSRE